MARILITDDTTAGLMVDRTSGQGVVVAEIVTLSEVDGIYAIRCTGDGVNECPGDVESGDTWSNFEDCVREAIRHAWLHERRS